MILSEKPNDVIVKGLGETSEFTIKTSAKAFKILSQNLYSNPVGAVVRELSTNAYDSHIMAGCPERPFKLKIPSSLDPEFSIRDYGTGLSHEDVIGLYSTFFESTKTQSNDMVGCLGLGSKSPFALTDSFFVISYFNGVKSVYSVFTDKNFIPSISLFGSEETEEENGLEIQIAVKNNQVSSFPYEVKKQLHFFKTKPIIEGYRDFRFNTFDVKMSGDGWYYSPDFNSSYVVQGQIAYPLDSNLVRRMNDLPSKFINVGKLSSRGYAFEMPIGSVDIAPSRESLSYDEDTINAIVEKARTVIDDIENTIIAEINNSKNLWEAINKKYDLDTNGFLNYSAKFEGLKYPVSSSLIISPIELKKFYLKTSRTVANTKNTNYLDQHQVNVRDDALFVRVKSTQHKNHDYLARQLVFDKRRTVYVLYSDLTLKTIAKKLMNPSLEIIEISDLNYKRVKRETVKKEVTQCKQLTSSSYKKTACWSTSFTDRLKDTDFYVEVSRYDYLVDNVVKPVEDLVYITKFLREKKIIAFDQCVYGLTKKQIKDTKAVDLIKFVREFFAEQTLYKIPHHPVTNIPLQYLEGLNIVEKIKLLRELKESNALLEDYKIHTLESAWKIQYQTEEVSETIEELDKYMLLTQVDNTVIPQVIKMMQFCEENGFELEGGVK